MKMRLLLGFLAFISIWISSAIGIAIAVMSLGRNISDVGVPLYANSEMALFLGGIIYLLIFEVLLWGINRTIAKNNRFLQWFWLIPILLWSPVHFWLLLMITSF